MKVKTLLNNNVNSKQQGTGETTQQGWSMQYKKKLA
jgi:hypothetical protein